MFYALEVCSELFYICGCEALRPKCGWYVMPRMHWLSSYKQEPNNVRRNEMLYLSAAGYTCSIHERYWGPNGWQGSARNAPKKHGESEASL